jgi:hypothetical protein
MDLANIRCTSDRQHDGYRTDIVAGAWRVGNRTLRCPDQNLRYGWITGVDVLVCPGHDRSTELADDCSQIILVNAEIRRHRARSAAF